MLTWNAWRGRPHFGIVLLLLSLTACESAYYGAWEKLGVHKRDILTDRIEEVRDSQVEVKEQFSSALERFSKELDFDGGDLEDNYEMVKDEYDASVTKAEQLSARIDSVEAVAEALFDEWEDELDEYSNASYRRQSQQQLKTTRRHYEQMLKAMRTTEKTMAPVLSRFKDQSLYLKHNLNARAIASLKTEFGTLKREINNLIRDVERSITSTDQFLETLASAK